MFLDYGRLINSEYGRLLLGDTGETSAQCTRKLEGYGRERLLRGGDFRDNDPAVDAATGYQTRNTQYTIVG
jgi:hypothetical protein